MDLKQQRRLRRVTQAVYHAADDERGQPTPRRQRRFLPSVGAVVALLVVVAVIVLASVARWVGSTTHSAPDLGEEPMSWEAQNNQAENAASGPVDADTSTGSQMGQSGFDTVMVYVSGRVNHPSVVTVPAGSRVADALRAAGGPQPEADLAAINLARPVVDGEQIDVTAPGETPHTGQATMGLQGGGDSGTQAGNVACVDLNRADEVALQTLDGVGPALAKRIIAYRDHVGTIQSAQQLDDVSGIGPALVERITPGVCP